MRTLLIIEHDHTTPNASSLSALSFARSVVDKTGGSVTALLLGSSLEAVATETAKHAAVLVADDAALTPASADRHAYVIAEYVKAEGYDLVVAAATSYSKDVVGRAAGLLDGHMASDVVSHEISEGELLLTRPMFAGSVVAVVKLLGSPKIVTVRDSAYDTAEPLDSPGTIESLTVESVSLPGGTTVEDVAVKKGGRPDVTEASIVVSGGRAWKSTEDFEKNVGRLADVVGGAVGSSRVLVDAGITPNEMQVGQTGKIIAPDLYLALGISGAVQHLAGMKNSKVIAAINSDKEAPIFQVSDYGIVGDVYELTPQLIAKLSDPTETGDA